MEVIIHCQWSFDSLNIFTNDHWHLFQHTNQSPLQFKHDHYGGARPKTGTPYGPAPNTGSTKPPRPPRPLLPGTVDISAPPRLPPRGKRSLSGTAAKTHGKQG